MRAYAVNISREQRNKIEFIVEIIIVQLSFISILSGSHIKA